MPENVKTIDCNFRDSEHEAQVHCRYELGSILFEQLKRTGVTGMIIASVDNSHTQLMSYKASSEDMAHMVRGLIKGLIQDNKVMGMMLGMEIIQIIKKEMDKNDKD